MYKKDKYKMNRDNRHVSRENSKAFFFILLQTHERFVIKINIFNGKLKDREEMSDAENKQNGCRIAQAAYTAGKCTVESIIRSKWSVIESLLGNSFS